MPKRKEDKNQNKISASGIRGYLVEIRENSRHTFRS